MPGSPSLLPSGFLDVNLECDGPTLYKSTPSREAYAPTLNDFMAKYVTNNKYTDYSLLELASTLKTFSRKWPVLPESIKTEFIELILKGDSDMSKALVKKLLPKTVEKFTDEIVSTQEIPNNNFINFLEDHKVILTLVLIFIILIFILILNT